MQIESEIKQHLVDQTDFSLVKMDFLNRSSYHIRQLGNLLNASSELPDRAMMDLKQAYRRANRHEAAFRPLWATARKVVSQYWKLTVYAAKQRCYEDIPSTTVPIERMMKNPLPEIKTFDNLAKCCAIPKGELQNHIAWCCIRFADFADYGDQDQYFGRLNDTTYIWHNPAVIAVTSFECNEQAVHMDSCTGSTRWRTHKPPRNGMVHFRMGTSPDSRCKSPARQISARLKFLFFAEDA